MTASQGRRSFMIALVATAAAALLAGTWLFDGRDAPAPTPPVPAPVPAQPAAAPPPAATPNRVTLVPGNSALSVLLQQAQFRHDQHDDDAALDSLDRALRLSPGNADALALTAQIQAARGIRPAPATPPPAAVVPSDALAVTTLQALAAAQGGYEDGKAGLARLVRKSPSDLRAQLAYAQVLTLQDADRLEGINRLAALSREPELAEAATRSWRQALLQLPDSPDAVVPLEAFLLAHADDTGIAAKLAQARHEVPTLARETEPQPTNGGQPAPPKVEAPRADAAKVAAARPEAAKPEAARSETARSETARSETARSERARSETAGRPCAGPSRPRRGAEAPAQPRRQETPPPPPPPRALDLREQANAVADPATQAGLYRAAVAADPDDPWLRLDLARALVRSGQSGEARSVMADAIGGTPTPDALRAGILFANETNDPDAAAALVERLPPALRTPEMSVLQSHADIAREIGGTRALPRSQARQRLLALAATPDPDGARGAAILRALAALDSQGDAAKALAAAQAATPGQSPTARLRYAAGLLDAGQPAAAEAMLAPVAPAALPTDLDREDYRQLEAALAVRGGARGRQGDAYDRLAAQLAGTPDSPLVQSARDPRATLQVSQTLLRRDPANADARRAAVAAALQLGERDVATTLVQDGLHQSPNDPKVWIISADLARANGDYGRALRDLRHARDLRRQQLGADTTQQTGRAQAEEVVDRLDMSPTAAGADVMPDLSVPPMLQDRAPRTAAPQSAAPPAPGASQSAAPPAPGASQSAAPPAPAASPEAEQPHRLLDTRPADVPQPPPDTPAATVPPAAAEDANPFRRRPAAPATDMAANASDPLTAEIDHSIADVRAIVAPSVQVGFAMRGRSGTAGSSRLTELAVPLEATYAPGGYGQLKLAVTPTLLANGTAGGRDARGVGLDVGYALPDLAADVGASLGFREQTALGGAEWAPLLAPGVRLRLTGERRVVGDSELSYAGAVDPRTGRTFGGVVRNHGRASLEFSVGQTDLYLAGGGAELTGDHVRSNTEYEAGAGAGHSLFTTDDGVMRIGLDLTYFSYAHNLRYFTLGQGGYFSPQSYYAAMVPLTWVGQVDPDLTYEIGAAAGFESFHEHESPDFPLDGALGGGVHDGEHRSGAAGEVHAIGDYRIATNLHLGARLAWQHTTHFNEGVGTVYARYLFNGAEQ